MTIAFLVPCLNEEAALGSVLEDLAAFGLPVFVVDDGSTDKTAEIALAHSARVIRHVRRRGKGEALKSGWAAARARGHHGIITVDGDGQHRIDDIRQVLEAARQLPGSIVIGARLKDRQSQPRLRRLANGFGDWAVTVASGQPITDSQSGLRYYPGSAFDCSPPSVGHFAFESAVLVEASRRLGMRIAYVPIHARYGLGLRGSHFRPVRDIARIARYLTAAVLRHVVLGRLRGAHVGAGRDGRPHL
jgi:glycosyltransferase involved in cell wall biosynthesis